MRILGRRWKDGYLDETRLPGDYRIEVRVWARLAPVQGIYFQRGRDWRVVWNYLREIGVRQVLRKVLSRRKEALRNAKHVAVGAGVVLAADRDASIAVGETVAFVAPCHPPCVERLVLPPQLVRAFSTSLHLPNARLRDLSGSISGDRRAVSHVAGWSPHAGIALDPVQVQTLLGHVDALAAQASRRGAGRVRKVGSTVREYDPVEPSGRPRRRAALYGYGNYAKHVIIPGIRDHLDLVAIHELDPTQLGVRPPAGARRDTSPILRHNRGHDVAFIAGYHHTHAPLAATVLREGGTAVVEKPIATTNDQLAELTHALRISGGRLFGCFHKRYSPFNSLIYQDLACSPGDPISYHCVVYEVPLPPRHWYRWPSSRSRLTSNGCHWLDHFLFLNAYADVRTSAVTASSDGKDIIANAELANGAYFSMALTSKGSSRVGLRNHVELRTEDRQVVIGDDSTYRSETSSRVLRRATINRMVPYQRMYESIAKAAVSSQPGDSPEHIRISASLVLNLEGQLSHRSPSAS